MVNFISPCCSVQSGNVYWRKFRQILFEIDDFPVLKLTDSEEYANLWDENFENLWQVNLWENRRVWIIIRHGNYCLDENICIKCENGNWDCLNHGDIHIDNGLWHKIPLIQFREESLRSLARLSHHQLITISRTCSKVLRILNPQ